MTSVKQYWDLEQLKNLFSQAGAVAMRYFDAPPTALKDDRTVVTAADREIEKLFAGTLDRPAEQAFLIGEETVEKHSAEYIRQALQAPCCWVVDPIDGTAPYSTCMDFWGISLGLLENGILTNGAVYLPRFDILLATSGREVVMCSLQPPSPWQKFVLQSSQLGWDGHIMLGQMPTHKWGFAGRNTLFALCSCVASFYLLFCGKAIAYCGNFKLWDIAGILPIAERLNCAVLSVKAPHRPLSGNLAEDMFELNDPQKMWWVKEPVIAGPDRELVLTILKNFYNIEPLTESKL